MLPLATSCREQIRRITQFDWPRLDHSCRNHYDRVETKAQVKQNNPCIPFKRRLR